MKTSEERVPMTAAATGPIPITHAVHRRDPKEPLLTRMLRYLPRGNMLDDAEWARRHKILQVFLLIHLPTLAIFGVLMRNPPSIVAFAMAPVVIFCGLGDLAGRRHRRLASAFTTAGIVYCATILVAFSHGVIEAHFYFFIIIGFIALYQDWFPFLLNILFVVVSHGAGSIFRSDLMFNHHSGIAHPWLWSILHGAAVLLACAGTVLFWRSTEDETIRRQEGDSEIHRRKFTADLLVNLARRNQSMLYRQLDIINQLEEHEQDPDALAELFRIDHLATRIRRNAESLLVLAGEDPPRVWSKPVRLTDVVRAAIAETEDLNRVVFVVDERLAVRGQAVTDLTHLLAELIDNAVRSSPPETRVTLRSTPDVRAVGTVMLTVEDWGVGMLPEDLVSANEILSAPHDIDATVAKRLGLHVVSRLAHRYDIEVTLTSTSGTGLTAVVLLPPDVFAMGQLTHPEPVTRGFGREHGQQLPSGLGGHAPAAQSGPPPISRRDARHAPPERIPQPQVHVNVVDPPQVQHPVQPQVQHHLPPQVQHSIQQQGQQPQSQWEGWWDSEDGDLSVRALPSSAPPPYVQQTPAPAPTRVIATPITGLGNDVPTPPRGTLTGPGSSPVRLNKRTPQAHLAPELQRRGQTATLDGHRPDEYQGGESRADEWLDPIPAAAAPSAPEAARAREALSRYQASRRQALADHDTPGRGRS